jgi:hypothetical protein
MEISRHEPDIAAANINAALDALIRDPTKGRRLIGIERGHLEPFGRFLDEP